MKCVCRNVRNSKLGPEQYVLRCCQIRLLNCTHSFIPFSYHQISEENAKVLKNMPKFSGRMSKVPYGNLPKIFRHGFSMTSYAIPPQCASSFALQGQSCQMDTTSRGTRIYTRTTPEYHLPMYSLVHVEHEMVMSSKFWRVCCIWCIVDSTHKFVKNILSFK
jgi:hypothetical protein